MSNTYRYPQMSDEEKKTHNRRHHEVRREYYRQHSIERIMICAWMCAHPEEVERIKVKYEVGAV